jgi:hypothetical protein
MPEKKLLHVVRSSLDETVDEQWSLTLTAFQKLADEGDATLTPRDVCHRFSTPSKRTLFKVLDAVIEQVEDVSAVSLHGESSPEGFTYVIKVWKLCVPRMAITRDVIRQQVIFAKGLHATYAGWATSIVPAGGKVS